MKTIRKGDRGPEVKTCQERLTAHSIPCDADGVFGPGTEACVIKFQRQNNLGPDGIVGPATWAALMVEQISVRILTGAGIPPVIKHAQEMGHTVWDTPYRMWLFGIRSENRNANSFDDELGCAWVNEDGLWTVEYWPGTTDPGTYYLENPLNNAGCAILVEGQYLDTWMLGKHQGKYEALCQLGNEVRVYRDASRDNKLDMDPETITQGYFGINLHAATRNEGGESTQVHRWSAGCQVHATQKGFARMMELAHLQVEKMGLNKFSYTLMNAW